MGVALDYIGNEVSVCIENSDDEPQPLCGAKERNRVFDFFNMGAVPHLDELAKKHHLAQRNQKADVQMTAVNAGIENGNHNKTRNEAG